MAETRKYDLNELESHYRKLTTHGDTDAGKKMRSILANIRYDLENDTEVIMEYREGMEPAMVMRILRNEKDLERWIEQKFTRLKEFNDFWE